jgi:YD repeat-containing protein
MTELNMAYGYDAAGNITNIGDRRPLNQGLAYGYDALKRLTTYSVAGTVQETYTLDAIGNLTWKTVFVKLKQVLPNFR